MGQKNSEYIHFLSSVSADYWVWLSWELLTYDNAANPGLPQRNPSSKLFWLTHFWVNNIQLPSYYEKSAKTNKNWPIITKILSLIFGGKSYLELPWSRRDAAAHQRLSNITASIKTHRGEIKNSLGTINDSIFLLGWTKFCNIIEEVKNPKAFWRGVILRTRFSPGNSPG